MNICFYPFHGNNLYVNNIIDSIKRLEYNVISLRKIINEPKYFFKCKIYILNWFENIESNQQFIEYIIKVIFIHLLKICNKKIIFVFHNRKAHNSNSPYSCKLIKLLLSKTDIIIIMNHFSIEIINKDYNIKNINKKIRFVPHPNYIHNYNVDYINPKKQSNKSNNIVFLFIGAISPYKNIELIIDVFNKITKTLNNIQLIIAGNPYSKEYANNLQRRIADNTNIQTDFRYIPDSDIPNLYEKADIVVLPYDINTSLNSGAAFLSFSFKKTVLCPRIGTIRDFEHLGDIYSYSYNSYEEHKNILEKEIVLIVKDHQNNPNALKEKGERMFNYIKCNHSIEIVQECYKNIIEELYSKKQK